MLPLKVLKEKHRLPLTSSLPRKGKAGCLRTVKLLSTETKMREHRPRSADDRFLPLKWVSRVCSSSVGVFLFLWLSTWRHLIFHLSNQMVAVTFCLYWTCICMLRRRWWHPTPVLLPGKSHGWRSLVSCSPWGHKESDTTERLHFHFSLSCIGEGNGNPPQCSCLENPRDRGAWWASLCGVAQSWTRLKQLSSSSSIIYKVGIIMSFMRLI